MPTQAAQVLALAQKHGVIRPQDLDRKGIPRVVLTRLTRSGQIERAGRGLYVLAGREVTEHHTLAEACKRIPQGVVCLLSALRYHGLTTQQPFEVWLAIDRKARRPRPDTLPLRIVRFPGAALTVGVETHAVEGVPARVTSPARTVVDCFRYRNKIGLDVALEALRDYRRCRVGTIDDLWRVAEAVRMTTVIRPYLEATE